jgi:hypothetical protein
MVQSIQELVMGAANDKKTNQALMKNLSDITMKLQDVSERDRLMEEENAKLRHELNVIKEKLNHNENIPLENISNLDDSSIPGLVAKWEADFSIFRHQLKTMSETDLKIEESRIRLNDEIMTLRLNRNRTMETLERITETGLSLFRKKLSALLKANNDLSLDNIEMKEQLTILNNTLQNSVSKGQLGALTSDYNQRFQTLDSTFKNISSTEDEILESCCAEKGNENKGQVPGIYKITLMSKSNMNLYFQ